MENNTQGNQGHRPPPNGTTDGQTRVRSTANAAASTNKAQPNKAQPNKPRKKKKKLKVGKYVFYNLVKTGFIVCCIGLMLVAFIGVELTRYIVKETENDDIDLMDMKLQMTSYIMAQNPDNGEWFEYQELVGPQHRIWVSLDEIPNNLINAMISTEDRHFETNKGFDLTRTVYAAANELLGFKEKSFGASTITQQLIKNITGDDDVVSAEGDKMAGYTRKLREIFRAWGLTNRSSKDMIMEAYLNTMSLSGTIAGVQAGAHEYFNKDVSQLTLWECATIAGITRAPSYYSPFTNPETCLKRRNDVIQFMLTTECITQAQATEAWSQPLGINRGEKQSNTVQSGTFSYFSDTVFNEVVRDLMDQEICSTRSEAIKYVYTKGLRIYATVDLNLQKDMENMYANAYNEDGYVLQWYPDYFKRLTITEDVKNAAGNKVGTQTVLPQSSAVSIRYDGSLAGVVGGFGEKAESLGFNRATQSLRQTGSTMKPIAAYALGIDYGAFSYSSLVIDEGFQPRNPYKPQHNAETGEVVNDWPKNFSNKYRHRPIPIVSAISESTNTVAVSVGNQVGERTMFDFLRDTLQVSSLVEERVEIDGRVVSDVGLAPMVMGALTDGMSAYELAGSFMMFGGKTHYGEFNSLHSYSRVETYTGELIMQPKISSIQAISTETGYVMNRLLSTVIKGGAPGVSPTAGGMMPEGVADAVGKTGTTNDDKDRWFVGLTPDLVTAVWWGYDKKHDFYSQGWRAGPKTNLPTRVWKQLMEDFEARKVETGGEGYVPNEFPPMPENVKVTGWCASSGDIASDGCPVGGTGYYTPAYMDTCAGNHAPPPEDVPVE